MQNINYVLDFLANLFEKEMNIPISTLTGHSLLEGTSMGLKPTVYNLMVSALKKDPKNQNTIS